MAAVSDYYTLLGVTKEATSVEIKTAFKKLALRYHPDVYKGADAHERMSQILLAYQTLNDPEARKQYDAEYRAGSGTMRNNYTTNSSSYRGTTAPDAARRARQRASSWARRDRQRYYDFPDFMPGRPVHIDLIDISYTLSQTEARELVRNGLLRGTAPENGEHTYFCHRCHHRWEQGKVSSINPVPQRCPDCLARDWTEYLLLRCMHCRAVFESEQIRYTVGALTYGKGRTEEDLCPPYELFPLCPYCGESHWSQAEEDRVEKLRQRAAQASRVRMVLIGLVLVAVVAVIFVTMFLNSAR